MIFEWDEAKARSNRQKHGLNFEAASRVFFDAFAISEPERVVAGEERWQTIGMAEHEVIVVVAHTIEDTDGEETVRIISARRAGRAERKRYETHRAQVQKGF